jgi:hypothetical protein
MNALCLPTVVASPNANISDIAVDSTYMYWTQGNEVAKKPFSGGNIQTLAGGLSDPRGIVVDNINAYWVDFAAASVSQALLIGGAPQQLWPPTNNDAGIVGPPNPTDVAADGTNVYWVTGGVGNSSGQVLSVPIGSGGSVTPKVISSSEAHPIAVALDANNVYWVDEGDTTSQTGPFNGSVNQAPKQGGAITPLATGLQLPWDVAVDQTSVYWTEKNNPGAVKKLPIGGGPIVTLAQGVGVGAPYGIAVDSQYVYWTDYDNSEVLRLPKGGGSPLALASTQNTPAAITVDQVNVYWVSGQQILKVAK